MGPGREEPAVRNRSGLSCPAGIQPPRLQWHFGSFGRPQAGAATVHARFRPREQEWAGSWPAFAPRTRLPPLSPRPNP
eukprot:scaffold20036_cov112-Isochrysis_galbana.AAC.3